MDDAYVQPFRRQPWRFLWWLDDKAHHLHIKLPWVCDRLEWELHTHDV